MAEPQQEPETQDASGGPAPLRFPGAARARQFAEPAEIIEDDEPPPPSLTTGPIPVIQAALPEHHPAPAAPQPPASVSGWDRFIAPAPVSTGGQASAGVPVWQAAAPGSAAPPQWAPEPPPEPPAQWSGSRERWVRVLSLGAKRAKASPAELRDRHLRRTIREATWPRSALIGVVNEKGGVGKTRVTLVLAGILAAIRGGGVAAVDLARSQNGLGLVSEGRQARCISELADDPGSYATPGKISAFAARQSSFADVIASLDERSFDDDSVRRVMYAVSRCYSIAIADTGNAHEDSAYHSVTHAADVLVLPVVAEVQAIHFGLKLIRLLRQDRSWEPRPIIVALLHTTGGPLPGGYSAQSILHEFQQVGVAATIEIPYDAALSTLPITVGNLGHTAQLAWTELAAAVVSNTFIQP